MSNLDIKKNQKKVSANNTVNCCSAAVEYLAFFTLVRAVGSWTSTVVM